MEFAYCSCNGSIPADPDALRRHLPEGVSLRTFDTLCRGGGESLEGAGALLLGCARNTGPLAAELAAGDRRVRAWDVADWVRGLPPEIAARAAAGYAAAARELVTGTRPAPVHRVAVGPTVLVEADAPAAAVAALADQCEVVWAGPSPAPAGAVAVAGPVTSVAGSLGRFRVTLGPDSPVDPELCVGCGRCVAECPTGALDGSLRLDRELCDGCARCEHACLRVGALDLDRTSREVAADQVILGGGGSVPRPGLHVANGPGELGAACVAAAGLAAAGEVDTTPSIVRFPERCAHGFRGHRGCQRCLEVCPTGALASAGDAVALDDSRCSGCGRCAGACPGGALQVAPGGDATWGGVVGALAQAVGGAAPLALCCDSCAEQVVPPSGWVRVPLPPLAALGADTVLAALARGAGRIGLFPCGECASAARQRFEEAAESLGRAGRGECLSWRGERSGAEGAAAGPAPVWPAELPGERRPRLAALLEPLARAAPGGAPLPGAFGSPRADSERCSGCGACLGACPGGALRGDSARLSLDCVDVQCVGCGLCAAVCPEEALQVESGLPWGPESFAPRPLVRAEGWACPRCGEVFATRRSVQAVAARLARRLPEADVGVLELCPDCRVRHMALGD